MSSGEKISIQTSHVVGDKNSWWTLLNYNKILIEYTRFCNANKSELYIAKIEQWILLTLAKGDLNNVSFYGEIQVKNNRTYGKLWT